jgi:hypothetical protein
VREGKHGARSTKQAIAIGLSKARRAGIPLKPPTRGQTSDRTRRSAERAYETGQGLRSPRAPSARRSRAMRAALEKEPSSGASSAALSRQAHRASARRSRAERSGAAKQAAATKGPARRASAARQAAATRARRRMKSHAVCRSGSAAS